MKYFLIYLLLFAISPLSWCNTDIEYNDVSQTYRFPERLLSSAELFTFVSTHSGIRIFYAPSLVIPDLLTGANLSEDALMRFLDSQFSVIKTFNEQKEIISLQILPTGQYQSDQLIQALETRENKALTHQEIANISDNTTELRQQVLKAKAQHQAALARHLEQQQEFNDTEQNNKEVAKQARLAKELDLKNKAIAKLSQFKHTDKEIYDRLLRIYVTRYPNIESEVNDQDPSASEVN